ncbi:Uncharacterized protein APZ42_031445 [Daphnia magna]|uniref:Uncharacterized protein n=1 Tax=Daphnia magna TaxID=35525 RepID=A0A162DBM3_9CRUS|nr:Uncharacterized protein APZ42_031445 [Daphnia magna]
MKVQPRFKKSFVDHPALNGGNNVGNQLVPCYTNQETSFLRGKINVGGSDVQYVAEKRVSLPQIATSHNDSRAELAAGSLVFVRNNDAMLRAKFVAYTSRKLRKMKHETITFVRV